MFESGALCFKLIDRLLKRNLQKGKRKMVILKYGCRLHQAHTRRVFCVIQTHMILQHLLVSS